MAAAAPTEPLIPMYATDENAKPGFVRVSVIIPELKTKTKLTTKGFRPCTVEEPSKARVNIDLQEWSMIVSVWTEARDSQKGAWYELRIRRLIKPIDQDNSYYEFKEGRILLFLKKRSPESWNPELQCGLDGFEDDDIPSSPIEGDLR